MRFTALDPWPGLLSCKEGSSARALVVGTSEVRAVSPSYMPTWLPHSTQLWFRKSVIMTESTYSSDIITEFVHLINSE